MQAWTEYNDESGRQYWYNNETGENSWEAPASGNGGEWNDSQASGSEHWDEGTADESAWNADPSAQSNEWTHEEATAPAIEAVYVLPPGWTKEWDEGSQLYYYTHPEQGITQWEQPEGMVLTEAALAAHTVGDPSANARHRWRVAILTVRMMVRFRTRGLSHVHEIPFSDTDSSGDGWVTDDSFESLPGGLKNKGGVPGKEKGKTRKREVASKYRKVRQVLLESEKGRHILEVERGEKVGKAQEHMDDATLELLNAMMMNDIHSEHGNDHHGMGSHDPFGMGLGHHDPYSMGEWAPSVASADSVLDPYSA
jgi:hypothetical protein